MSANDAHPECHEGYYWIQIGECEPEPALIRGGEQVFVIGASEPFDLEQVKVRGRMEAHAVEPIA